MLVIVNNQLVKRKRTESAMKKMQIIITSLKAGKI